MSSGLNDAIRCAYGKMNKENVVIASMDFSFIGGSMGSVVGEKIARAIDHAKKKKYPPPQVRQTLIAAAAVNTQWFPYTGPQLNIPS